MRVAFVFYVGYILTLCITQLSQSFLKLIRNLTSEFHKSL